jgi:cytoskeleton protein RodZ
MTSIGETLRRERLRRGWSLEQVAAETKITVHLLEAIEADQFDRLPGGVFARNFVRQYARMLQLDEDEIITAFRQQFEEPTEAAAYEQQPESVASFHLAPLEDFRQRLGPGSSLSAFIWLVVVMLACAGVYGLWQRARHTAAAAPSVVAVRKTEPQPAPAASPKPAEAAAAPDTQKQDFRPAEVSDSGAISALQPPAPEPVGNTPAATDEQPVATPGAVHVALTASEPVWVSIKSDGAHIYSGTLDAQQSREFDAAHKMTVLIGNAGSLEVSLNGNPVGPIGPRGEIRTLVLTPEGAHVVPRTPPTPPPTSEDSTAPTVPEPAPTDRP